MTRRLAIVIAALALAIAACDRVVELFPTPDAGHFLPDAAVLDGVHDGPLDAHAGSDGSLVLPDALAPDGG